MSAHGANLGDPSGRAIYVPSANATRMRSLGLDPTLVEFHRYRTGTKLGRTIYAQLGPDPSEDDPLLGIMETALLASCVVELLNEGRLPEDVDCGCFHLPRHNPDCPFAVRDTGDTT